MSARASPCFHFPSLPFLHWWAGAPFECGGLGSEKGREGESALWFSGMESRPRYFLLAILIIPLSPNKGSSFLQCQFRCCRFPKRVAEFQRQNDLKYVEKVSSVEPEHDIPLADHLLFFSLATEV